MAWTKKHSQWIEGHDDSGLTVATYPDHWRRWGVERATAAYMNGKHHILVGGDGYGLWPDYLAAYTGGARTARTSSDSASKTATLGSWLRNPDLYTHSKFGEFMQNSVESKDISSFRHVGLFTSPNVARTNPDNEGALFRATFPEPSHALWHVKDPYIFPSGGGTDKPDPWVLDDISFTMELSFYVERTPNDGAVLFQMGETIKVYYDALTGYIKCRLRMFDHAATDTAAHTFQTLSVFPVSSLMNWPITIQVYGKRGSTGTDQTSLVVGWGSDGVPAASFTYPPTLKKNFADATRLNVYPGELLDEDISLDRSAKAELGGKTIKHPVRVHEPLFFLNSWDGSSPWWNDSENKRAGIVTYFTWKRTSDPDRDRNAHVEYRFNENAGATQWLDAKERGNKALGRNITATTVSFLGDDYVGVGLTSDDETSCIYVAPHLPKHTHKIVMVGDDGNGNAAIMRAVTNDGRSWHWFPRERPLALFKSYYETLYPNGQIGTSGSQKPIGKVGAMETPQGQLYLYYDQWISTSHANQSRIMSVLLGDMRTSENWLYRFHVESDTSPSGAGNTTPVTAFNPRSTDAADVVSMFDGFGVEFGSVSYDAKRNLFKLWYTGRQKSAGAPGEPTSYRPKLGWTVSANAAVWTGADSDGNRPNLAILEGDSDDYDESGVHAASMEVGSSIEGVTRHLLYVAKDDKNLAGGSLFPTQRIYVAENTEQDDIKGDPDQWEPTDEEWDTTTDDPDDPLSAGNRILGMHRHYHGAGESLVVASGGQLYNISKDSSVTDHFSAAAAPTELWDGQTFGRKHFFEDTGAELYICNGIDTDLWRQNAGDVNYRSPNVIGAGDAIIASAYNGGDMAENTSYYWKYSFVRSGDSYETSPSGATEERNGAGEKSVRLYLEAAELANRESTTTGLDTIRFYGSTVAGVYYLADEVEIASATGTAITGVDWMVGTVDNPKTDSPAPDCRMVEYYHGIPFYVRLVSNSGHVAYGNSSTGKRYNSTDYFDFAAEGGGDVVAAKRCHDYLLVFCERAIYAIYGDYPTFRWRLISDQVGLAAPMALCSANGPIVFLARDGVYITNGQPNDLQLLSAKVRPRILEIPGSYIDECCMEFHANKIWMWFPHRSNINKRGLVYDLTDNTWVELSGEGAYISCAQTCRGAEDRNELLGGDSRYGFVQNIGYGDSDNGAPIRCEMETGQINLMNAPEWDVLARKLYVDLEGDHGLATFGVYADGRYHEWNGSFNISTVALSIVASAGWMQGMGTTFQIGDIGKTRRESSLSQNMVGRRHSISFMADTDKGTLRLNGFTLMSRKVRRR